MSIAGVLPNVHFRISIRWNRLYVDKDTRLKVAGYEDCHWYYYDLANNR